VHSIGTLSCPFPLDWTVTHAGRIRLGVARMEIRRCRLEFTCPVYRVVAVSQKRARPVSELPTICPSGSYSLRRQGGLVLAEIHLHPGPNFRIAVVRPKSRCQPSF
jgi:hypothetical protein